MDDHNSIVKAALHIARKRFADGGMADQQMNRWQQLQNTADAALFGGQEQLVEAPVSMEPQVPIEMPQPSVGGYSHGGYISMHHMLHRADGGVVDKALQAVQDTSDSSTSSAAKQIVAAPPVRKLSPLGFYSYGAETAASLPQTKGSPSQMAAMLQKSGVKPAEMEGFSEAFAGRPSVTRDEIAAHFRERMPQVEERVLGAPHKELSQLWPDFDRQVNKLADDWGITNHGPIVRGEYNPDFYPKEALPDIEKLASLGKRIGELSGQGHTMQVAPTKFSQYTLPGGKNYREVLLKMPHEEKRRVGVLSNGTILSEEELANPVVRRTAEKIGLTMEDRMMPTMVPFKSQHWDDPNVLAHLRLADRTGPNGEKILHVEEIQSDWAQQGRKVGFSDPASKAAAKEKMDQLSTKYDELGRERRLAEKEMAELPDYNDRFEQLQNRVSEIGQERDLLSDQMAEIRSTIKGDAIPSAPYVTNTQAWTDLALKRALKEAAEGGYDKLVWTPGAEQAKRYDLANHVERIAYDPEEKVLSYVKKGEHGNGWSDHPEYVEPKDLPGIIGKDVADRLLKQEPHPLSGIHEIEGADLSVGGEGMKGYYDKIVPTQLSKLVKKLDPEAKIEQSEIPGSGKKTYAPIPDEFFQYTEDVPALRGATDLERSNWWNKQTKEERKRIKDEWITKRQYEPNIVAPSLTITPKMRKNILKGQTAYAQGGSVISRMRGNKTMPIHPALNIPGVHIRTAEAGEPIFHGEK